MLSIIIPTYNEMQHGYLRNILEGLSMLEDIEILCVDSGSTDGTLDCIHASRAILYMTDRLTRAERMNLGIEKAKGDMLLLYHPRILIPSEGIVALSKEAAISWGGFIHAFTGKQRLLRFISWYSNAVRFKRKQIVYLDHGVFLHKQLAATVFPIPADPIFEDTVLSQRLKAITQPTLLPYAALVSPVRFHSRGPWRQFLSNQALKLLFTLGISTTTLNNWYEKKLKLNS